MKDNTKKWIANIIKAHRTILNRTHPGITPELVASCYQNTHANNYDNIRNAFLAVGYDIEK